MARNYRDIQKNIALTGFFSEYLPPCFSLDKNILSYVPPHNHDKIPPYSFTMSRFNANDARRTISIPEIGSYLRLYSYLKNEDILKELIEFSEKSTHSFSKILGEDDSIIYHEQIYAVPDDDGDFEFNPVYINNIKEKIEWSAGAKKILKLDISNCYKSVYTHMIPAIILGIDTAGTEFLKSKHNPDDPTILPKYKKYKELDVVVRAQNLDRTNGLLVGPLYSKIIVEALLTRVDAELDNYDLKFARYVDDYEVFLYDDDEKQIISIFSKVFKQFGLTLNFEKTEVIHFPFYIKANFNKLLEHHLRTTINTADLIELFNNFFNLETSGEKGAIRYLLKSLEYCPITIGTPSLYKAYLLSIMSNNERSLTKACSFMIENKDRYPLSPSDVETIKQLLDQHIEMDHDLEVVWLLYLLIKTDHMQKQDDAIDKVISSQNELANLLLLKYDLLDDSQIMCLQQKAMSWLMLYELYADGHIEETEFCSKLSLNNSLSYFQKLKDNNMHFFKV